MLYNFVLDCCVFIELVCMLRIRRFNLIQNDFVVKWATAVRFHLRVFNVEPEIDSTFRVEIFYLENYAHYLI